MPNKRSLHFLVLLFIPLLMACPTNDDSQQAPIKKTYKADSQGLERLHTDLMHLIADTSCQHTSDCALLPIGARACGGPDSYAAYSKNTVDAETVNSLAKQYSSLMKVYNETNQVMSICMVEPRPSVSCVKGQCVRGSVSTQIQ